MVSHPTKCHWLPKGIDQYITVKTWWPQTHHCVQHVCICPEGRVPSSSAGQWAGPRALDQSHGERKWRSSCLDRCRQCPAFCRSSGWRSYRSLCLSPSVHHLEECEVEKGEGLKHVLNYCEAKEKLVCMFHIKTFYVWIVLYGSLFYSQMKCCSFS